MLNTATSRLTNRGALIQAIGGQQQCTLGAPASLIDNVFLSNPKSFVFSFAADQELASAFCGHYPTTSPVLGRLPSAAVCATTQELIGATSPELPADVATLVSPTNSAALTLDALKAAFPQTFDFTATTVTINNQIYQRAEVAKILQELSYVFNIANNLDALTQYAQDGRADVYTFALSSVKNVANNAELINFIYAVVDVATQKFATLYNNNLLSQVISTTTPLSEHVCQADVPATLLTQGLKAGEETVTVEQVRSYQIVLWLVIALIATAIAGFSATSTMHILPDPALAGGISTAFVHKK